MEPAWVEGSPVIGRLAAEELDAASRMAARAFHPDPASCFLFPNELRRKRMLQPYLHVAFRFGHEYGLNCAPAGSIDGAAVWMHPPGRVALSIRQLLQCGLLSVTLKLRPLEFLRLCVLDVHSGLLAPEAYTQPHLYLWLLAVDPTRQRTGLGSALVREGLARADAAGVPCLLETMTEKNVRFYQRHGFEVVGDGNSPWRGPHVWIMRRQPRPRVEARA